jgi:mannosyltransferase OCH1-like enzyme
MVNENPDFLCEIFDIHSARDFISRSFGGNILIAYDKLKPYSYKSDLFRFCYMYVCGGIYVDIKYEAIDGFRFKDILDKEYLASEPLGVQTCIIALKERNPLMIQCINEITRNTLNNYYGYSPLLTGPYLLSENYKIIYGNNRIDTDLRWSMEHHLQHIYKNDRLVLRQYPEYRDDLSQNSDQPHYTNMFWSKNIYN